MARIVFLGTPVAAIPALEMLVGRHDVGLVVTQPDRARGRSKTPSPPPVKELAASLGLETAQPENRAELTGAIDHAAPFDVGVVVAYGRILSPQVLAIPMMGFLNVHFSLLPRWRGAAPVARALMAGDTMTGVTIIRLDEGLDTGPVLTAQAVDIDRDENAGELTLRLANLGARLLLSSLDAYLDGRLVPVPQTDEGSTHADKLAATDRPLRPADTVEVALGRVRGLAPSPAATLEIDGKRHKILKARAHPVGVDTGLWRAVEGVPVVGLSDGGIEVVLIQPPGKGVQEGADWLRGRRRDSGLVG